MKNSKLILTAIFTICSISSVAAQTTNSTLVDAEYIDNRIFVSATSGGEVIKFYTDSGGGFNAITASALARLKFKAWQPRAEGELIIVPFPKLDPMSTIGRSPDLCMRGQLAEMDKETEIFIDSADGFLGGCYLGNFVWRYDYPGKKLWRIENYRPSDSDVKLPFTLQKDKDGKPTTYFARIEVEVDGSRLYMLFDTGATASLTESSAVYFGKKVGAHVGISFIETSILDEWHQRHPEWKVIEKADGVTSLRMIEVPSVSIAGISSGPVWFAEKKRGVFTEYMSGMMDGKVVGALGGSALRYYDFVIEYSKGYIYLKMDKSD